MREIVIDGVRISDDSDCYVIAEIGHNHQGNLETAKELFRAAKDAGAHAAKLQKRSNRQLFTRQMYDKPYDNENSYGSTYGEHREFLEFGREQYAELQRYAKEIGISFFATAFDVPSAGFLADLDVPAFKLASGDLTNIPLLQHVARFGKPMIVSTGGGTMADVRRAYEAIMPINRQLCILQCTAGYPPAWEELNLSVIPAFREAFPDIVIGFSSHDSGIAMAVAGYVLGARVIEKHFTLNRAMKGTDHAFSLEPTGLRKMVRDLRRTRIAMGDGVKVTYPSERAPLMKMAKKLVAAREVPAGHRLTLADVAIKSPSDGLPPYELDTVVGRVTRTALSEDETISLDNLEAS
ncbi:MAG TPA: N-acetylneuraminate synthase family protein [Thermoanaerobaculia bacterium]|nr:N-acetylneuraminate synthase family protein [Thermoanaerobaculia bacterium]